MHKHKLKKTPENRGKFYWPGKPPRVDMIRSFTCSECGALFFIPASIMHAKLSGEDKSPLVLGTMWWKNKDDQWESSYTLTN